MAALDATTPDLQLDDIMHNMSPSPTPQQPDPTQAGRRSASPEPLTEADIVRMRHRVAQIGLSLKETGDMNDREKELISMVHRLTASTLIDPSQLIHQAEVISGLTAQRDFLVRQADEERERWLSERDGWIRMAEALIAQRTKMTTEGTKDVDLERYCAAYESDNRALREKLNDTQTRLQCLEAELTKLRPILLMQPVTSQSNSSVSSSVPYPNIQVAAEKAKPKKKKKKEARVPVFSATISDEPDVSDDQVAATQPVEGVEQSSASASVSSSFFQFQAQPPPNPSTQPSFTGDHYRKPTAAPVGGPLTAPPTTLEFQVNTPSATTPVVPRTIRRAPPPASSAPGPTANAPSTPSAAPPGANAKNRSKSRRAQGAPLTPLTSDARTEHLLLAARKIGRERAGMMAGYVRDRQREVDVQKQEKERERTVRDIERLERERAEKLAERGSGGMSYYRPEVGGSTTVGGPQTPKRGSSSHYPNADASPMVVNTAFVMVEPGKAGVGNDGGGDGHGKNLAGVAQRQQIGNGNKLDTPTPRQEPSATSGSQQPQGQGGNPTTPLASLLDAARMMDDAVTDAHGEAVPSRGRRNVVNGNNDASTTGRRRGVAAVEQPESPPPKRRRVQTVRAPVSHFSRVRVEEPGPGRVKSALDVLADQAAAFSSHDHRGKGKGREVLEEDDEEDGNRVPVSAPKKTRGRGKAPAKETGKEKEKPKSKPKPATTRKPRGKAAAVAAALAEKVVYPMPVTLHTPAVPRMISPPGPRLPTSTLDSLGSVGGSGNSGVGRISPIEVLPPRRRVPDGGRIAVAALGRQEDSISGEANPSLGVGQVQREVETGKVERRVSEGEGGQVETDDARPGVLGLASPPEMQESRSIAGTSRPTGGNTVQDSEIREVDLSRTCSQESFTTVHHNGNLKMAVGATHPERNLDARSGGLAYSEDDENREQDVVLESEKLDRMNQPSTSCSPQPLHRHPHADDSHPPQADRGEDCADADPDGDADADAEADLDDGDGDGDGDVDADGEVDAEGELDLDEMDAPSSTPPPVPDPPNSAGTQTHVLGSGAPNGRHPSSQPMPQPQDASLPRSGRHGPARQSKLRGNAGRGSGVMQAPSESVRWAEPTGGRPAW